MFSLKDDEEDDFVISPDLRKNLDSLFDDKSSDKESSLKYVAPKKPRSDSMASNSTVAESSPEPQPSNTAAATTPVSLIAKRATVYLNHQEQTKLIGQAICCILGFMNEMRFVFLVYKTREDQITQATIRHNFHFLVQKNNFINFFDDNLRNWSICLSKEDGIELATQIGICRCMIQNPPNNYIIQDLSVGKGRVLTEDDTIKASVTVWQIEDCKKGKTIQNLKKDVCLKLSNKSSKWQSKIVGCQQDSSRLVFLPKDKDNKYLVYSVTVDKIKGKSYMHNKSYTDTSEKSCPPLTTEEEDGGDSGSEDDKVEEGNRKESLVSRMAKVGRPLLPTSNSNKNNLPTDSESDMETVRTHHRPRTKSRMSSDSVEEIMANPAVAPKPVYMHQPVAQNTNPIPVQTSQMVPYPSSIPWMHHPMLNNNFISGMNNPKQNQNPPPKTDTSDKTMSLLLSESRSQNTELRISVSQLQDKVDSLCQKVDTLSSSEKSLVPRTTVPLGINTDPEGLLTQITSIVQENQMLKSNLQDKDAKLNDSNSKIATLLYKNQQLLEEKTDYLTKSQGNNSNGVSFTQFQKLSEENETLKSQEHTLKVTIQKLQERISKLENNGLESMDKMKKENEDKWFKIREMQECIASLSDTKEKLEDNRDLLEVELQAAKNDLDVKIKENEQLHKRMNELSNKNHTDTTDSVEIQETKDKLKNAEMNIENLSTKLSESEKILENYKEQNKSKLEEALQKTRNSERELELLRNELDTSVKKCRILKQENIKLKNDLQSHPSQINLNHTRDAVMNCMNLVFKTVSKVEFKDQDSYTRADIVKNFKRVITETTLNLLSTLEENSAKENEKDTPYPNGSTQGNIDPKSENHSTHRSEQHTAVNQENIGITQDSYKNPDIQINPPAPSQTNHKSNKEENSNLDGNRENSVLNENVENSTIYENGGNSLLDKKENSTSERNSSSGKKSTLEENSNYPSDENLNSTSSETTSTSEETDSISTSTGEKSEKDSDPDSSAKEVLVPHNMNTEMNGNLSVDEIVPNFPKVNLDPKKDTKNNRISVPSSPESAWKPQPPPTPIFSSDDEANNEDDWLS